MSEDSKRYSMKIQDTRTAAALAFTTKARKLLQVWCQLPIQSCPRLQAHGDVRKAAAAFELPLYQRRTETATVLSLPPSLAIEAFHIPDSSLPTIFLLSTPTMYVTHQTQLSSFTSSPRLALRLSPLLLIPCSNRGVSLAS